MSSGLQIDALTFRYPGRDADAVDGASLRLQSGELLGLMGHNGAGKSTLLRLACGLLTPAAGTVTIDAQHPHAVPPYNRIRLARMALQTPEHQLFRRSVREELEFDARTQGVDAETHVRNTAAMLERFGLNAALSVHPYDLDLWARKVLTLAMALVSPAAVIALDEPTNRLDSGQRGVLSLLVREVAASGRIVLISSHDAEFCAGACTQLAQMRVGRLALPAPAGEVWGARTIASSYNIFVFPSYYLRRAVGNRAASAPPP